MIDPGMTYTVIELLLFLQLLIFARWVVVRHGISISQSHSNIRPWEKL